MPGNLHLIAHPGHEWEYLALVIIVAIIGIYALLRVTLSGARSLGKVTLPPKIYKRVLMPAVPDMGYAEETVTLACKLAGNASGGASVLLTYVIEVPRALAPDAAMPQEEAEAQRVLDAAAASVRSCGLQAVTQVRKGRAAVEETLRALNEEKADLLVLTVPPDPGDPNTPDPFRILTTELARRAPCEVILAHPGTG